MKMTSRGQLTIPPAMRKKHGLTPECEVELVDRPEGLLVRAAPRTMDRGALAALLNGPKVKGRTTAWLRLTRGNA